MEFVSVRLGGPGLVFAERNRVRIPFVLSAPAAAVYPMLQSFRLVNTDDDRHLRDVQIRLVPFFNAGVSTTQGEVEIETTFADADGGGISADLVEMEVVVLVVGV
jgi:hypothetical protein